MTFDPTATIAVNELDFQEQLAALQQPEPLPAPSFTVAASITHDGTPQVGDELTGMDGTVANGTISGRRWLRGGTQVATSSKYAPTVTGAYQFVVTAVGDNGQQITSTASVLVTEADAQPIVISPAPAAYSDSFVGDGALHTRPNWSVTPGEENRWGTSGGQLFFTRIFDPLSRAIFGGTLADQEVELEYDTTTQGTDPWTTEDTFFDLFYQDANNFIRTRFPKGVGYVQINPVVNGTEIGGSSYRYARPTAGGDKGKILFKLSGGFLRIAIDGVWVKQVTSRQNFPLDRLALPEIGVPASLSSGKMAVEARTWTYSRADAISVYSDQIAILTDDEFVGRDSTTATGGTWTGTGTYAGTPAQWAVRVLDFRTGSVVVDWAAPKAVTANAGAFSVDAFLPLGGPYAVEVAWIGSDGFARITRSRPVLSGYHVVYYGQSNSAGRADVYDEAVTGDRYACFVNRNANADGAFPAGHWASTLTGFRPSACMGLARTAAPLLNVPVAITATGVGATGVEYLSPGGAGWTTFLDQVSTLKGVIEAVVWDQGEADADGAQATPNYVQIFRDVLLPGLRQRANNPTLPVLIAPPGNYPDPPLGAQSQAALNAQRDTIRFAHQTLVDTVPGVSFAGFKLGAYHASDPYHYPRSVYDGVLGTRDGLSVAKALGASTYDGRGPQVTGATRSGAAITLAIDLNGATGLTGPVDFQTYDQPRVAAPSNAFKGYEVSADNFATNLPISEIAVTGGNLVITLASAPSGAVKVRSFAGANHDDSSLFVGAYAGGLTIPVAPIIKHLTA